MHALGVVSSCSAQTLSDRLPARILNGACNREKYGRAFPERDARQTMGRGKGPQACGGPSSSAQLSSVVLDFFRRHVLGAHHRSRTVILLQPLIRDQVTAAELLSHG